VVRSDVRERGDANARWSVSWDPIGDFLMRTAMVPHQVGEANYDIDAIRCIEKCKTGAAATGP
jgi:hypothetical protein